LKSTSWGNTIDSENLSSRHSWNDTDVINGKTYYYAVVSYDRGDAALNMYPSECSRLIVRDINGNVQLDKNTIEITPQAPAAGYKEGGLEGSIEHVSGFATGDLWIDILDPLLIKEGYEFEITFDDTQHVDAINYNLVNITETETPDTILNESYYVRGEDFNSMFDGMRLFVFTDSIEWDAHNSGWTEGNSNIPVRVDQKHQFPTRREGYPSSYDIRFGDPDSSWWYRPRFPVNFSVWDIYENKKVLFALEEPDAATRDSSISVGTAPGLEEYIRILILDGSIPREIWRIVFLNPLQDEEPIYPSDGDILKIQIKTPFRSGDTYRFSTRAAEIDRIAQKSDLDKIAVVPNPYVVAARWEPPRLLASGRGERRIFFIHLPTDCTIRIFTISGDHVQTIDHQASMIDGSESWDLKSKDGLDVAPGIYIFHADAPGVGEKIGRFALIK